MKASQRVVWSEGMLMSPQHLQALDHFHEELVEARIGSIAPYGWGVVSCSLDQAALGAGQVRLARFAGVLPDGTAVSFDEGEPEAPPSRPIGEHFPAAARTLEVHLSLAREREGVASYEPEGNGSRARYLVASRAVQDASSAAGAAVAVAFGKPNLTLLFGDEPREDYETIKIAEVVRGSGQQLAFAESYVPPALRLSASPWLVAGVRQIAARVVAKQRELAEGRGHREPTGNLLAAELSRLLQHLSLAGAVPVIAHLAEAGDATPREAFLFLAQLAGQLSTFARGIDPAGLPKFSHTDLRGSFEPLFARLASMLGGLAVAQYVSVPLEHRPGGLHLARISDDRVLRSQLFLAVKSDLPEQQVAEQLPRLCKIASTAEIQGLVQAAAPGLPLQVEHRPPPQLPMRPATLYFSLGTDNRYWQGILANHNLVVYLPPPYDPARTVLELLSVQSAQPDSAGAAAAR